MITTAQAPKAVFAGDKKHCIHFMVPVEQKLINFLVPRLPLWLGTAQLTLMTIGWSAGIVASGYMAAKGNMNWLWLFSVCIALQHITDMLDGAVGRARNTGLIKWGFYMDHFLDYVFLSSIVIGYSFLLPLSYAPLTLACLAFSAGFMIHAFMDFSITSNFKISCSWFGVSEMRWVLILFNTVLVFAGKALLVSVFPIFTAVAFLALCALVYMSQRTYRHLDALRQAKEADVRVLEALEPALR